MPFRFKCFTDGTIRNCTFDPHQSKAECLLRGQERRFDRLPATSGLDRSTDIIRAGRHVSMVPIVLKKSLLADD
jgi:hypothetical protein